MLKKEEVKEVKDLKKKEVKKDENKRYDGPVTECESKRDYFESELRDHIKNYQLKCFFLKLKRFNKNVKK